MHSGVVSCGYMLSDHRNYAVHQAKHRKINILPIITYDKQKLIFVFLKCLTVMRILWKMTESLGGVGRKPMDSAASAAGPKA